LNLKNYKEGIKLGIENYKVACFDVYYREDYARASCIVFELKPFEKIISQYNELISPVDSYISGEFYRRELPCILKVYGKVKENIELILIDGFVSLRDGKKGLGGYLYEALDANIPVIGIAKTFYEGCNYYIEVYRGESERPLYINSIGIKLDTAATLIKNLEDKHRIPNILKMVDKQSRSEIY
jgi:deoxyribonuclease V